MRLAQVIKAVRRRGKQSKTSLNMVGLFRTDTARTSEITMVHIEQ